MCVNLGQQQIIAESKTSRRDPEPSQGQEFRTTVASRARGPPEHPQITGRGSRKGCFVEGSGGEDGQKRKDGAAKIAEIYS